MTECNCVGSSDVASCGVDHPMPLPSDVDLCLHLQIQRANLLLAAAAANNRRRLKILSWPDDTLCFDVIAAVEGLRRSS